jgi:hypothetical protein
MGGVVTVTVAEPEPAAQVSSLSGSSRSQVAGGKGTIESEIVIIDDDGTEEPFDPSSWFS